MTSTPPTPATASMDTRGCSARPTGMSVGPTPAKTEQPAMMALLCITALAHQDLSVSVRI